MQKVYPSIDQPRILTFAYLPHSHATTLWYLFFALLSSRLERSAAKSSCGDMAWMASYSLLKPMSPSACREATCRMKRWAGMAVLVKLVLLPVFPLPREVVVEEGRSMSQSGTMDGAWENTGQ